MTFAVLLAAGSSSRFREQTQRNKLRIVVNGKPIWRHAFDRLHHHPEIDGVGIVCPEDEKQFFFSEDAVFIRAGGMSRAESSLLGVSSVPEQCEFVLVHDAARPVFSDALVSRVLRAAKITGAAIPATRVADTIKRGPDFVKETVAREDLFRAQTPQAAKRDVLLRALQNCQHATDEAMALEAAGAPVALVEGEETNVKITSEDDLSRLFQDEPLMGFGYDIHRFDPQKTSGLVLGGVTFPDEPPLQGHSDADVVLHAVTDAILGLCGLGDIGLHFPNTDAEWKGADSRIFLRKAAELIAAEGVRLVNVDVTILAEFPKLGYKREEMRATISKELGIEARNVNIKASTAEGLGAIGRREGIAAMAVAAALRRMPF